MSFRLVGTGGASCCEWVVADGVITLDSPQTFKKFLSSLGRDAATLQETMTFNSPGGDFFAALALGREIRRNTRLWTSVGRTEAEPGPLVGGVKSYHVASGVCMSACVLAFLGGKTRVYDQGSGASAQSLAFQAYALDQPASVLGRPSADAMASAGLPAPGILRLLMEGYAAEMGVDPAIVTLMETTDQAGGVHVISQDEADTLGLNTPRIARTKWTLSVKLDGLALYGSGDDRWTHYTVGLQCVGREGGAMEYAIAVPVPNAGQIGGNDEARYKQAIERVALRDRAGALSEAKLASVQLLKGKLLLVSAWLNEGQVGLIRKGGATLTFETARYLSNTLPDVSLATSQVTDAIPVLLRNCPRD